MATTDQNSSYTPPAGVTLDMSKSKPVGQAPAYTPPAGVQLDMSKSQPVTPPASVSAPAATDSSVPDQPGVIQRGALAVVNNTPLALIKPPETPTEQVIHAVSGDSGLAAYRAAMGVVDTVKKVVTAGPEAYANAVQDYKRAHQEFINKDYRNAASSAGSLATDVAHVVDPTLNSTNQTRQLTEGARPGADLTTPLVGQIVQAGMALAGGKIAGAEPGAAATTAADEAPSMFQRYIVNPFRRAIASPSAHGDAVATEAATAGTKAALNTGARGLLNPLDVETPYAAAKNLYRTVDKAAGTNFDDLYTKLSNAQDRVMETTDGSVEEAKALADVKRQEDVIAQAKQRAADAGVKNVDQVLAQADKKFTEAQANKEFNFKIKSAVSGHAASGAPETVSVDQAISIARKMSEPTIKYPTPRLYQTTAGETGANNLLKNLYAAKKAGQTAVDMRVLRNWVIGGAAAIGADEAVHRAVAP